MRYEQDCELPEIVKTMPHITFEVEDICKAIQGKKVIIEPNSPSEGNIVAFIEENGPRLNSSRLSNKKVITGNNNSK